MRRRSPVPYIIVLAWAVMAVLLVRREYFSAEPVWRPCVAGFDTLAVEEWAGIYLQGQKIGYAYTGRVSQGDTLYRIETSQVYRLTQLGQSQVLTARGEATLNSDYSLRSFYFAFLSDDARTGFTAPDEYRSGGGTSFEVEGGVDGRMMKVEVRQGGQAKGEGEEREIPLDGPLYFEVGPELLLAEEGFIEGRRVVLPSFDPLTMSVTEATITVAGRDTIDMKGVPTPAWRLESSFMGLELRSWVDGEGRMLLSRLPLGITYERETRTQAVEEGWDEEATLDLVNIASIPAGVMKIPNARDLDSLTVRLGGIDLQESNLTFGRQELIEELVEIKVEDLDALTDYELPNRERALRPYLRATAFVQSDHPMIRGRAPVVRGGERSARAFAEKLVHHVYEYLQKVPSAGVPNAVEVLRRRRGDCNEHTVLYTALARASGLPTVMNAGVVYLDGRFYYHAWPSVWLGEWVAVDPTFDQFPADATHISFIRGGLDRQVELMRIIGRVTIDVVSIYPLPGEDRR